MNTLADTQPRKKGTVPICAQHPSGRSGKWGLSPFSARPTSLAPRAFTLVEMLVVVAIIGILAGLITAAAWRARIYAKEAAVALELKQLEMACQAYKEKYSEYPPDFCMTNTTDYPIGDPVGDAARAAILRHLTKLSARYIPGISTGSTSDDGTWDGFVADVNTGWGINVNTLTPFQALRFWLGGRFDTNSRLFTGFSANQANPFDASPSRVKPFFEFDVNRVGADGRYWPQEAIGDKTTGAIVYFRAENNRYDLKSVTDNGGARVFPAVDVQQCDYTVPRYAYVNPKTFQIFSAGLDCQYTTPMDNATFYPGSSNPPMVEAPLGPLMYPTGGNYNPNGNTFDDITNFSGGTLESKMP